MLLEMFWTCYIAIETCSDIIGHERYMALLPEHGRTSSIVHGQNMFDHDLAMVLRSLSNMVRHVSNILLGAFWKYIMATGTWFKHHRT